MFRPSPGDVLVSRSSARADRYSISVIPDTPKKVLRHYEEAIEAATQLARERAVNGWYTCDHTHFLLVARHRHHAARDGRMAAARARTVRRDYDTGNVRGLLNH